MLPGVWTAAASHVTRTRGRSGTRADVWRAPTSLRNAAAGSCAASLTLVPECLLACAAADASSACMVAASPTRADVPRPLRGVPPVAHLVEVRPARP